MWQLAVGGLRRRGRGAHRTASRAARGVDTVIWFVGGFAGGFPVLLLALIAPRAGQPWRSRAFLAVALFGAIALGIVLLIVAISEANFVTP